MSLLDRSNFHCDILLLPFGVITYGLKIRIKLWRHLDMQATITRVRYSRDPWYMRQAN